MWPSEVVGPEVVKEAAPMIDVTCSGHAPIPRRPVPRAWFRWPADAVAWGWAGADQRGVEIHQQTEVLGIDVEGGKVKGRPDLPWLHRHGQAGCARWPAPPAHPQDGGHQVADLHPPAAGDGQRAGQALA